MKNLILAKVGDYTPNLMSEFVHTVNNSGGGCFSDLLRFVRRTDYTFRLYRDPNLTNEEPLAIVPYSFNPATDSLDDATKAFRIDFDFILNALQSHEFVLVGKVLDGESVSEANLLGGLQYLSRDSSNTLIDLLSGEPVVTGGEDSPVATVVSMFGVVKLGPLPIYYLILDSGTTALMDFIEYTDSHSNNVFFPVMDYDGTLASHLMHVKFQDNVTRIGKNHLFVKGGTTTLQFFTESWAAFLNNNELDVLPNVTVSGTCTAVVDGNKIHLTVNKPVSTLRVEFDLGRFFEMVQDDEKPKVEFIIYAE